MERQCKACGRVFTLPPRAGRPPVLCDICRAQDVTETVRVVAGPDMTRPVRLLLRRPGHKTKFVSADLTRKQAEAVVSAVMLRLAGITKVRAEPAGPSGEPGSAAPGNGNGAQRSNGNGHRNGNGNGNGHRRAG